MGNKSCIKDYTEKREIVTQKNEITKNISISINLNNENAQIIENGEEERILSGEEILKPDKKTEILTPNEYIEFAPLSFNERKELAKKLFKEGTDEKIKKALYYDNTSIDIFSRKYDCLDNGKLFVPLKEQMNKLCFEKLILEIITSDGWDKSEIDKKFKEYKNELNNRIKFNQPIDTDNKALFFYKSKMHILINLLEGNNIMDFQNNLEEKRDIYKKIGISKIIKNNQYPEESSKLKLFMVILNLIDDEKTAVYLFNSILEEKYDTKYYYDEILKLKHVDKSLISYNENSIIIGETPFKKNIYSLNSLIYFLQKKNLKNISPTNEYLYKYDYFIKEYWINEYLPGLKEILTIIIKSKYYSTIISELFNKKENEIKYIQKEEFIDFLFSKINIIPIPIDEVPFLDKFSLDIFLGEYASQTMNLIGAKSFKEEIEIILKLGNQVIYLIHEGGGHFIYSYFTLISNNYYHLKSPNIKINNKTIQKESGEQLELLLFKRVVRNLELKECLFLLNTNNHTIHDHFDRFRKGFVESTKKTYKELTENFNGPFSELVKGINWKKIKDDKNNPISISFKNRKYGQPSIGLYRRKNDAIGGYEEKNLSQ